MNKTQHFHTQLNKLSNLKENLKIKFADTYSEFMEAMQLVHQAYAKKKIN